MCRIFRIPKATSDTHSKPINKINIPILLKEYRDFSRWLLNDFRIIIHPIIIKQEAKAIQILKIFLTIMLNLYNVSVRYILASIFFISIVDDTSLPKNKHKNNVGLS